MLPSRDLPECLPPSHLRGFHSEVGSGDVDIMHTLSGSGVQRGVAVTQTLHVDLPL